MRGPSVKVALSVTAAVASVLALTAVPAAAAARQAASGKAPIKIALITSETGVASQQFHTTSQGFLARIGLQNAHGGIHGHKIDPIVLNDQSSLTTVQTDVQQAISEGALGIVSVTPFFFAAYRVPQQDGIPVTGGFFDGPEWGTQPNTNMFASDAGSVNPKYPANTGIGKFLKAHGATVVGTYGYGISPSSTRSAIGTADSAKHAGLQVGVLDTTITFGSVNFTSVALTAKQKGVNAVYAGMDDNSNFALMTALEQAGVKLKAVVFPTGYEPDVIHSPAWSSLQGAYFSTGFRPFTVPDAGTRTMAAALKKYAHRNSFPSYNIYESWLGADLMIRGIEKAGSNPTHASVIKALRSIKSYNGGGLLPQSIDYATIFGHDLPKQCGWYMKAEKKGFVPTSKKPICGTDIPGTTTVSG